MYERSWLNVQMLFNTISTNISEEKKEKKNKTPIHANQFFG